LLYELIPDYPYLSIRMPFRAIDNLVVSFTILGAVISTGEKIQSSDEEKDKHLFRVIRWLISYTGFGLFH